MALVINKKAQVNTDVLTARQQVQQAITELETLEKSYAKQPIALKLVQTELSQAKSLYQEISGKEEVNTLEIFHNLSLVKSDFLTTAAETTDDTAWFMDSERKELIGLDLEKKSAQTQTIDAPTPRDLTLEGQNVWLLAEGLRRTSATSTASATVVKENNDQLKGGTAIGSFGKFIYVLNPEKRDIFRLAPSNSGYGDPTAWFRGATTLDFGQVTSMSIDGDIWLGLREGQIKRFRSGREIAFTIEGLADPFQSSVVVYTRENLTNVYVLDAKKQRLVILTKDGKFIKEIKSPSLASATSVVVSEKRKLILPVSGALLYKIDL